MCRLSVGLNAISVDNDDAEMATRMTQAGRIRTLSAMVDRRMKPSKTQRRSRAKSLPTHLKYVKKNVASMCQAGKDTVKRGKGRLLAAAYDRLINYRKTAGFDTEVELLSFIDSAKAAFPVAPEEARKFTGGM